MKNFLNGAKCAKCNPITTLSTMERKTLFLLVNGAEKTKFIAKMLQVPTHTALIYKTKVNAFLNALSLSDCIIIACNLATNYLHAPEDLQKMRAFRGRMLCGFDYNQNTRDFFNYALLVRSSIYGKTPALLIEKLLLPLCDYVTALSIESICKK